MADHLIRPGGEVRLPAVILDGETWVYPEGLTEGNLIAMRFAAQERTNDELRRAFGPDVAQVLIDRGFGLDQLPPPATTVDDQCATVERALRLGLVRDAHGRPIAS